MSQHPRPQNNAPQQFSGSGVSQTTPDTTTELRNEFMFASTAPGPAPAASRFNLPTQYATEGASSVSLGSNDEYKNEFMFNPNVSNSSTTRLNPNGIHQANDFDFGSKKRLSKVESNSDDVSNPFSNRNSVNPFTDDNRILQDRDSEYTRINDHQPNTIFPERPLPPTPLYDNIPVTNRSGLPLFDDEPLPKKISKKRKFDIKKVPFFTWTMTLIQIIVFIVELGRMSHLTGSAFQTKPYFNPMLGPSTYLLINMGARFVPCMGEVAGFTNITDVTLPCPNSTSTDTDVCYLPELCGLSGIEMITDSSGEEIYDPKQWYRIFIPIYIHAGFLHIISNMFLQLSMAGEVELMIGVVRFAIVYIASGIAGFLLGANFSPKGMASTGASGSLFGIIAVNILMFIFAGRKGKNIYNTRHYKTLLFFMLLEIVVSFVLGLLPGMDNFSHIGGFAMGLLLSILLLKDPPFIYDQNYIADSNDIPLTNYNHKDSSFMEKFNYQEKLDRRIKSRFIMWCALRVVCLILAIAYFVGLARNFFVHGGGHCSWCKYINCIPVHNWCETGNISIETSPSSASTSSPSATSLLVASSQSSTTTPTTGTTATPTTAQTIATTSVPAAIDNPNADTGAASDGNDLSVKISPKVESGIVLYGVTSFLAWRYTRYRDLL